MRSLIRFAIAFTILAAAMVSVSRLIGGHGHPLAVAAWFTNPDGATCERPCLFGIIPGETSYQDAIRLIEQHSLTRSLVRVTLEGEGEPVVFAGLGAKVTIWSQLGGTVGRVEVDNVEIHTADTPLRNSSLADLILYLGSPTNAIDGGPVTHLQYRSRCMTVVSVKSNPTQPIRLEYEDLLYAGVIYSAEWFGQSYGLLLGAPWRGFTISTRYLSAR